MVLEIASAVISTVALIASIAALRRSGDTVEWNLPKSAGPKLPRIEECDACRDSDNIVLYDFGDGVARCFHRRTS
jgi:hypothetical protein